MAANSIHDPAESRRRTPAPGELGLVQAFVNTRDLEDGTDTLTDPEALRDWLADKGLMARGEYVGESDLRQALEAREALRALALANCCGEPDPLAAETLNRVADRGRLAVRFQEDGGAELDPRVTGATGALGRILGIVYTAMAKGTWPRLKACRCHTCHRAFYDRSKNRSSIWCAMTVCGSREKAKAYRRRRREADPRE